MCYMELQNTFLSKFAFTEKISLFYATMKIWSYMVNTEYSGVLAANHKLNWYLALTKVIITLLWKKENEAAVSLLIILYTTTLYNDVFTCIYSC